MKTLSLTQPWASLVAIGAKCFETRSWRTDYRGALAIHAAKGLAGLSAAELVLLCNRQPFYDALEPIAGRPGLDGGGWIDLGLLPFGAIIAVGVLHSCLKTELLVAAPAGLSTAFWPPLSAQEHAFGDYSPGRYAWRLTDVRRLAVPIPAIGALGLWEWAPPADLATLLLPTA